MSIGYRYTRVFYIENSYNITVLFKHHDRVKFLYKDLISWKTEKAVERPDLTHHRNIYKESHAGWKLKKKGYNLFMLNKKYNYFYNLHFRR